MNKGSFAKFLIVLVLISGTLSGCLSSESPESQDSMSPNTYPSPINEKVSSPISSEVKQKFKELKNAYDKYKESQDQLLSYLPDKIDENNPPPQINTKEAGDKLEEFAQASKNFRKELQSLNQQDGKDHILEQLEQTQTELSSKVLKPLENGLQKTAIVQVQKSLNFFNKEGIPPSYYGSWGPTTKQYTTDFLQDNATKLATNIQDLQKAIYSEGTPTKKNSTTPSPRPSITPTPLPQKSTVSPGPVKDLTGQVKDLTGQVNNLKLVSSILLVVAILAFFWSISIKKFIKTKIKTLGKVPTQQNNRDSYPQMNQEDYNQLYRKIYQSIYQEFSLSFTKINNRLEQLEQQRGLKVNHQENKILDEPEQAENRAVTRTQSSNVSARGSFSQQDSSQSSKLITNYNQNPSTLLKSVAVVSETEESINNRRLGSSQPVVLEESRKGNYCIINEAGVNYMVPKENLKVNQYNYNTMEVLFECRGYQSGYSSSFQLVKPARVSLTSGNKWQLIERGIVEFYS
ncbi:MAG: hypothetical protein WBL95_12680 [Microcoleus sp.]